MKKNTKEVTITNSTKSFAITMSSVEPFKVDVNKIQKQAGDIVFWGDKKNSFIKYLSGLTQRSVEHAGLLDTKRKYIYSGGLSVAGANAEQVETFLKTLTSRKKPANEVLRGFSRNYPKFEIAYFEVIYGKGLKQIVSVTPLNTPNVLPNKGTDKYGDVIDYTFCTNFEDINAEREVIPRFDTTNPAPKQIAAVYIKGDLQPYFPDLSYGSALNYIELSTAIGKYLLSYADNSMTASGILNIQTENMPEEVFEDIERQLQDAFSGVENAGRIFVFANPSNGAVKWEPLSAVDNTAWVIALNDIAISKTCSAHKANPMIAALSKDGNGFSSAADEVNEAVRNFYIDQIQPAQDMFLDFLNEVLAFNQFTDYELSVVTPAKLKPVVPDFIVEQLTRKKWAEMYGLEESDFEGYVADEENTDDVI